MKKIFALATLTLLFISVGFAQTLVGIKAGGSITNITLNQQYKNLLNVSAQNRIGYQLGLFAQRAISENIFMRTELAYSVKGYKSHDKLTNREGRVGFNYISLPLLLGYQLNPSFSAFLGPEIAALGPVHAGSGGRRNRLDIISNYEKLDLGLSGGIMYTLAPKLGLDLRYTYGLSKILITDLTDAQGNRTGQANQKNNKALSLSVNYYLRGRV
ncbi:porin family protein [Adhaeribacter rhizoryzae]|uniref:PorT family protein n=1 Tax=Adhaeribacter rhizoryzae TaxID=2607907 RepID=A0A5M6DF44_9BACT|nr:porin family protein [Adhaeribacter rhizoryzae]KAA5545016.1 PorT family protein [Adhaeribacter rhizoryzae]